MFESINVPQYSYYLEICEKYKYYSDLLFNELKSEYDFLEEEKKARYKKLISQNQNDSKKVDEISLIINFKKISSLHNLLKSNDIKIKKIIQKIQEVYHKYKYGFDKIGLLKPENSNNLYYNKTKIDETISILEMLISDNKKK